MTLLTSTVQNDRKSESGNVLFLILIAVALFAALSYAVTQSTRSGGGDASRETNLVNAAGITQYPASIKTAITRMVISNSVDPDNLLFDTPSTFGTLTDDDKPNAVFYPTGGGASYVEAPTSVMEAAGTLGTWHFNGENRVKNIGTTDSGSSVLTTDADVIAFLPGVKKAVCDSIHTRLGIPLVYATLTGIDVTTDMNLANPNIGAGGDTISSTELDGQPQGCFQKAAGNYVYYHVVAER